MKSRQPSCTTRDTPRNGVRAAPVAAPPPAPGLALTLPAEALRQLVAEVVREVAAASDASHALVGERLAYPEAEAAALLGLAPHQLRDERLRGRIAACVGPGRRVLYTRQALRDYLASRPWQASA